MTARALGVTGATGNTVADRSRSPQLAGRAVWDCPFPEEADDDGVDHAVVTLRVEVSATGSVASVQASGDSSHGFGREARRCALSKRWAPALDRVGNSTAGVAIVNVRFDR
jgi:protein TonB